MHLLESDARELLQWLESLDPEAASIHNAVVLWLGEGVELELQLRGRLEKLEGATARV